MSREELKGSIHGLPLILGLPWTIVSKRLFEKLEGKSKIQLQPPSKEKIVEQAGGVPLQEIGRGRIKMQVGSFSKDTEVIVGEIRKDVLLRIDIGKMDVSKSKGEVILDGHKVPCIVVTTDKARRVCAAETYKILGCPGMIIEKEFEPCRFTGEVSASQQVIEPPGGSFGEKCTGCTSHGLGFTQAGVW